MPLTRKHTLFPRCIYLPIFLIWTNAYTCICSENSDGFALIDNEHIFDSKNKEFRAEDSNVAKNVESSKQEALDNKVSGEKQKVEGISVEVSENEIEVEEVKVLPEDEKETYNTENKYLANDLYVQATQLKKLPSHNKERQLAYEFFLNSAQMGHAGGQAEVGLMFLTGFGASKDGQVDVPRGLLNFFFAAQDEGNQSTPAHLVLGYRHMYGIGVPKSCQAAVLYYSKPAEKVMLSIQSGSGVQARQIERVRLGANEEDTHAALVQEAEVIGYYRHWAEAGSVDAQAALGQLYQSGASSLPRDYVKAAYYFKLASEAGDVESKAHLGHMYASGLGVEEDNATALEYFRASAEAGSGHGIYGLGYMQLSGAGFPKPDFRAAQQSFLEASKAGSADAHFHLGVMHVSGMLGRKNIALAFQHFTSASQAGHVLSLYNLALLYLETDGLKGGCATALPLLKSIAEKGEWMLVLKTAHQRYIKGDNQGALDDYLRAAEMGLEIGQSNAAYLLERLGRRGDNHSAARAVYYHQLAANQGHVDALLRIGDAHFYGFGVSQNLNKSFAVYHQASNLHNAQAMFNLGIMYEHGWGCPEKDFILARRQYNLALNSDRDAYVPVKLAVMKSVIHSWLEENKDWLNSKWEWFKKEKIMFTILTFIVAICSLVLYFV